MSGFSFRGDKPYVRIESFEAIPGVIARMQQMGGEALLRIPMLQALHAGLIGFLDVDERTPSRTVKTFLAAVRLPAVVIIADDGDAPVGPDGIVTTQRLLRWAAQVVIHGTGGHVAHYRGAVMAATVSRRLVLIECPSRLIEAYEAAARRWATRAVVQVIRPLGEGQHPNLSARGPLQ